VAAGALREAEAEDVAATIVDVRDHPDRWRVADRRTGEWRDARLGDVTVLVPTRTSLPYLRDALEAAGLPYRLATGTLVYNTQEVRDALAALRAVDDPTDELSLVAALRSPLYACSDVDLFTYRHAGGRWDVRSVPPDTIAVDHPVRLALAHLRSLWDERWWGSPSALLDRLLAERDAFLVAFGDPRPTEVWRRLRFLVDQARSFEEAGGRDLRAFLDWAELQGADSARVHEPLLPETDDDAVSILTVHGAKGLEFPITVLSGMTTQPGARRTGVSLLWGTDRPEVSLRKGLATADHDPRRDLELEMDVDEKLRLLYVATTRARDHLVVSCHHNPARADTYAGRMWAHFADKETLWRRLPPPQLQLVVDVPPDPRVEPEPATDDRDGWIERRAAALAPHLIPRTVSATTIAREAMGPLEAEEETDDLLDPDDTDPAVPIRRRGRAGSAIGRAVHATLQVIDFESPADLDAQVRRQCDVEAIPDLVPTVAAMVRSALASEAVRLAAGSPHHRELYVAAPVGERVIEGYVDLLVEGPQGLVVIDYKTDSVSSEAEIDAKLATYELQGATYAVAVEAVTGRPVVDCRFVFCRSSGAVERSVGDLPAAMARVRAAVVGA
jgi:ATP-dependent exoDNAse (exonuclease V) beta subunit